LACSSPEAVQQASAHSRQGLRSHTPRVYVVAALTGNTGGGMFLDAAYLLRRLLRAQGHEEAEIVGLFFVPAIRSETAASQAVQNAHAALLELKHFSTDQAVFEAAYETAASSSKESTHETGPAFDRCILL